MKGPQMFRCRTRRRPNPELAPATCPACGTEEGVFVRGVIGLVCRDCRKAGR